MVLHAISATFFSNHYFSIAKLLDISFIIKYIIKNSIFTKKLGCTGL